VFLRGAYLGATDGRQRGDAGQLQHQNRGEAKKMWRTHWLVDELVDIFSRQSGFTPSLPFLFTFGFSRRFSNLYIFSN
jgi:hypothetical protein